LFVDVNDPIVGATHDGMVTCDCCGNGVLEVKYPYCYKNDLPETDESRFCMSKADDRICSLKCNHTYYYQVQLQLHMYCVEYSIFVVWSEKAIAVERVFKDKSWTVLVSRNKKSFEPHFWRQL